MPATRKHILVLLLVALPACASPTIETNSPTFDKTQYFVDLSACRGETAVNATFHGLGGALIGSAIGAAHGATHGAIAGDAPGGAIIGAVAGGVIGLAIGAYKPIEEFDQKVRQCLSEKGYLLTS